MKGKRRRNTNKVLLGIQTGMIIKSFLDTLGIDYFDKSFLDTLGIDYFDIFQAMVAAGAEKELIAEMEKKQKKKSKKGKSK